MAKSNSTHDLQGTIGGLTFVNSRAYGKHVRSARGTKKKAKVNKAFKKQSKKLLKANIPAKIVRDAVKLHLQDMPGGTLWKRLVSIFDKQLKAEGVVDFGKLTGLEVNKDHPFGEFLAADVAVTPDKDKDNIRVAVSYPQPPEFKRSKFIDGYRLGVIAIFPDALKNKAKSTAVYSDIIPLEEKTSLMTFEVPVPPRGKSCLLLVRIDGCLGKKVNNTAPTKGMKVAWAASIWHEHEESLPKHLTGQSPEGAKEAQIVEASDHQAPAAQPEPGKKNQNDSEETNQSSVVKFVSLEPFIPSGGDFERSKELFRELGFRATWEAGDYAGFERDGCAFLLQKYDNKAFAENLMISVKVSNAEVFWKMVTEKKLPEKFGISITEPKQQPYGKEVNMIDLAGVCWHFVEQVTSSPYDKSSSMPS
jgi:hypothetical protein